MMRLPSVTSMMVAGLAGGATAAAGETGAAPRAECCKDPDLAEEGGIKRVTTKIEEALTEKGWTNAYAHAADTLVLLHGASEKHKSLSTFYSGMGGYRAYRYRGWAGGMGMGSATTTTTEYLVGTLVVDIFDAKSKQLVFRGTTAAELSDKPEKDAKKLDKAASKMFKDFPPGSKDKKGIRRTRRQSR